MTAVEVAPAGATVLLPCGCPAREVRDVGLHQDGCPRGDLNIAHGPPTAPPFWRNDGGRAAAGYRGVTGDCVARAVSIVAGGDSLLRYQMVYDTIVDLAKTERITKRHPKRSHPRTGVRKATTRKVMEHYGGVWTPTMSVGSGTLVHVRADELPAEGRFVLNLSGHVTAWVDGMLHDTYDCSREGTRCVYGFWSFPD